MNKSKLTNLQISIAVDRALKAKNWSVRECCKAFNSQAIGEICGKKTVAIDKDLVQRVRRNKFSVVNTRVSKLCDFLEINLEPETVPVDCALNEEFHFLEAAVKRNPKLEPTLRALLANVAEVLTLME